MSAYLFPELPSKAAYKKALAAGRVITAVEQGLGQSTPQNGVVTFEGPHYPKPHRYYGQAVIKDGQVIKVS